MRSSNDFMDRIKFSLLYRSSFSGVFKLVKLVITKMSLLSDVLDLVNVRFHLQCLLRFKMAAIHTHTRRMQGRSQFFFSECHAIDVYYSQNSQVCMSSQFLSYTDLLSLRQKIYRFETEEPTYWATVF